MCVISGTSRYQCSLNNGGNTADPSALRPPRVNGLRRVETSAPYFNRHDPIRLSGWRIEPKRISACCRDMLVREVDDGFSEVPIEVFLEVNARLFVGSDVAVYFVVISNNGDNK